VEKAIILLMNMHIPVEELVAESLPQPVETAPALMKAETSA
jgi:hypothetical protein